MNTALSIKIKELRLESGLTQADVCFHTELSISTIQKLETGLINPTIKTINKLSRLYKYDLLFFLSLSRNEGDILSESLVTHLSKLFEDIRLDEMRYQLDLIVEKMVSASTVDMRIMNLVLFLKDIKEDNIVLKDIKIIELEKLLSSLNSDHSTLLTDWYFSSIEIFVAIFLSALYRMTSEYDKGIEILNECKSNLTRRDFITLKQHNLICSISISICYIYHIQDKHYSVIAEALSILNNHKFQISRYYLSNLQYRLAVAYLNTNEKEKALSVLRSIFLYEDENRKILWLNTLIKKYNLREEDVLI